jgi:hypothetical protein
MHKHHGLMIEEANGCRTILHCHVDEESLIHYETFSADNEQFTVCREFSKTKLTPNEIDSIFRQWLIHDYFCKGFRGCNPLGKTRFLMGYGILDYFDTGENKLYDVEFLSMSAISGLQ